MLREMRPVDTLELLEIDQQSRDAIQSPESLGPRFGPQYNTNFCSMSKAGRKFRVHDGNAQENWEVLEVDADSFDNRDSGAVLQKGGPCSCREITRQELRVHWAGENPCLSLSI